MKKSILLFIPILILGLLSNCVLLGGLSQSNNPKDDGKSKIVFQGAALLMSNCQAPSTTPNTGSGIFSKSQEISFYSSCKYYKTFYEVNGNEKGSIGSGSIRIPSEDLSSGSVSVVKVKYWSECYMDSGMSNKCPENESPKISEYKFDAKAPEVEILSRKNFYINSNGTNSTATVQFKVLTSETEKEFKFELIKEEKSISKIITLNSGTVQADTITSFPIFGNNLNAGDNIVKLRVYDNLGNIAETTFTINVDDTLPDVTANINSGLYGSALNIQFNTNTNFTFICYTTDGSEPEMSPFSVDQESTCKKGVKYENGILIEKTTMLKYQARKFSGNFMSTRTLNYEINIDSPTVLIQPLQRNSFQSTETFDLKFNSNKKGSYIVHITDGTGETKKDPNTGEEKFYYTTKEISNGTIEATTDLNQATKVSIQSSTLYTNTNIILVTVAEKKSVASSNGTVEEKDFTGIAQITVYRDDTPPISSIEPEASDKLYNQTFLAKITSDPNSISYYSINGGAETIYNPNEGIPILSTSTIKYYSMDIAGNKEVSKTITYDVDITPPIVTIENIAPMDKRISIGISSLSKNLSFSVKSNEDGHFYITNGSCESGTKLIQDRQIEANWGMAPPPFSAEIFNEGLSSVNVCIYDIANNLTVKSLSNIFRDEKGLFAEVVQNSGKSFENFRAFEMPGEKSASSSGNKILIITQGIVWGFEQNLKISVPFNCRITGSLPLPITTCSYKQENIPDQLVAQFAVPTDISEIATANKSNYHKIIYLAYPLGQRIEDRAATIEQVYLKTRLSATQLNASKVDWVGLSEGTLVNLELINKFPTISDKRIFIAAPFKGSIYRDALAEGMIGKEAWIQFKDIILNNAPEVNQLLENSDYNKTRVPQLFNSLLLAEHKNKSFLIPINFKNIGLDLVVSVDSQMGGSSSPFNPSNIGVVAGNHFEMGKSPTKESIRTIVNSILQTGKIPNEINGDLVKNNVPVNYINGKWIAPLNGLGEQGTFSLEPNAGKVELKIFYDNADWKIDSSILVDSNTYKTGFINTTANLNILKKDTGLTVNGPATLEIVFDKEKFKKTQNYTNRPTIFKEDTVYIKYSPGYLPIFKIPLTFEIKAERGGNTPDQWLQDFKKSIVESVIINFLGKDRPDLQVAITSIYLGYENNTNFKVNIGIKGDWKDTDVNFYGVRWEGGCFLFYCWSPGSIGIYHHINRTINFNGSIDIGYKNGIPKLNGSGQVESSGLMIDNADFNLSSKEIEHTDKYFKYRIGGNTDSCTIGAVPFFYVDICKDNGYTGLFYIMGINVGNIDKSAYKILTNFEFTLPVLDKDGNPVK